MKRKFLTVILSVLVLSAARADEITRRDDAPKPMTPEESVKQFQLPQGFRIELVAAEPLIADPSAMAFDSEGRIFVAEIHGYNIDGHLDIVELNKTGELDKEVRRILVDKETLEKADQQTYGVVKLLEDTDGDGRMDRATVWDDKIPACFGVVPARDGVIALCAPDIIYLGDTNHDGKPDVREVLFTGFGVGELWTRINSPRRSIDNWIYAGTGIGAEGTITGPYLKKGSDPLSVKLGFTSFRFKSDGSAIEPVTGGAHGFGQTINAWGDRFVIRNQEHALMTAALGHRYLIRNPYVAVPNPIVSISSYGLPARVYPSSKQHPWRTEREKQPQWVKFYGASETTSGFITSACGPLIYEGGLFPEDYRGDHFSCEPSQNLVHHCKLSRNGLRYSVRRAPNEQKSEFLTSTETWFRPVSLSVGPDGAMYIVDMYREIIEDYSAIPRYLQQQYGLIEGHQRGRIWRIVPISKSDVASQPKPASMTTPQLVEALRHNNSWWRRTAQQKLVEGQDTSAVIPLTALTDNGKRFETRLHALCTLEGLDAITAETIIVALDDDHFAVRMHALRLAEPLLDDNDQLLTKVLAMHDDLEPRVRLQLAFTVGESSDSRVLSVLAKIAQRDGKDPWMRAAILSSVPETAGELLNLLLLKPDPTEPVAENADRSPDNSHYLIETLASVVGARGKADEIATLLQTAGQMAERNAVPLSVLKGLSTSLRRDKLSGPLPSQGTRILTALLASGTGEARNLAFGIARAVNLSETPEMTAVFNVAANDASDTTRPVSERQAAMTLLANAPFELLAQTADAVFAPGQPSDLQVTAVESVSSADDKAVMGVLLKNWSSYTPKVRAAVITAVFSRTSRLLKLLDAIEQKQVAASEIDAFHRVQLRENSDAAIRKRAQALLTESITGASDEIVARFQSALDTPRDPQRGEAVYKKICAKCHRLNNVGHSVGPDLAAAKGRADETLLLDILRPSRQITVGYQSYSVVTLDGRVVSGILTAETATSITLRKEEGVNQAVLRTDIDEMKASTVSLMPEGMEKLLTPQDAADLIGFLRESLGPAALTSLMLFDEELEFPTLLSEGTGTVRIDRSDPFAGEVSLLVTPPQRFSPRMEGWAFQIRENPQVGEFRYLRFAWKTSNGKGIMLELADNGQWPPRHQKLRRYLSGKNTTRWGAIELSPEPPTEWAVVTRDLWKDFGNLTLTGIAPTAMGGNARFDSIELLRSLDDSMH